MSIDQQRSKQDVRLEIAVDHADAVLSACRGGAERLELCSALEDGGLTPSLGLVEWTRSLTEIPVHAMVRPRGGNFVYSAEELDIMLRDIARLRSAGMDGVVLGALTPEALVDVETTRRLVAQARPMRVAFHRAFDLTSNLMQALEDVITCGADILLTSGGAASLEQGLRTVERLVRHAGGRIEVMGGAGVRLTNARSLWMGSSVDTLHASLRTVWVDGRHTGSMRRATMGARDDAELYTVREEDVRQMLALLTPRAHRQNQVYDPQA